MYLSCTLVRIQDGDGPEKQYCLLVKECDMKLSVNTDIAASREEVWKAITDIESSAEIMSGINEIKVLENPADGLVGFKWEETRTMFGQEAKEIMWITDVEEGKSYCVAAENNGAKYYSHLEISDADDGVNLMMGFEGVPTTVAGKVMSFLTGFIFKGATEKALYQDLVDLKNYVEAK